MHILDAVLTLFIFSGEWTCQVTPSTFDSDDGLASKSATLVVRNPPDDPQIYFQGQRLDSQVW